MSKVTVIIPVYKVEKYIHECLDSVVNQTLSDIQIICVDDGSPDNCPQILDDYAAKDARITVIHQKNAGQSAARNAAYPYIKSEYTLFVDSDDWIERDLCEKAAAVADREQADMTYFFYNRKSPIQRFTKKRPFSEINKMTLIKDPTVWSKLWRTRFLLDNDIWYPESQVIEDHFVHWKVLLHHPKLALLPEAKYHYRLNPASLTNEPSQKYSMSLPATYDLIKAMLVETGNYHGEWKNLFLRTKLKGFCIGITSLSSNHRLEQLRRIKECIGTDEWEYLSHGHDLERNVYVFYRALFGSHLAAIENAAYLWFRDANDRFRLIRNKLLKRAS